ncbi:MAG: hypothetical protein U9N83_14400 [Thermodesulfobacteriota bacterium]|nr:hypothetical protein [Thermodesulfobacteriota bacterium]
MNYTMADEATITQAIAVLADVVKRQSKEEFTNDKKHRYISQR